jgi:hypothetical protein
MKNLDLSTLTSQIENVYIKYDKEIPTIKYLKFSSHSVFLVGCWEFYFDKINDGYVLSDVIDSVHTEDIDLHKIKAYIMCEILSNGVLPI